MAGVGGSLGVRHRVRCCLRVLFDARTTAGCGARRSRSSPGSAPSRSGSPTRARRSACSRAGSGAGRTARSARWRPGDTCRTSPAGSFGDTVDAAFDAGRMSCAPWQSAHAAAPAEPSCVTLPWNVRVNDSATDAWHEPHSAVAPSRDASVSTRWIACAVWQSAQTGARESPFFRAAACTLVS